MLKTCGESWTMEYSPFLHLWGEKTLALNLWWTRDWKQSFTCLFVYWAFVCWTPSVSSVWGCRREHHIVPTSECAQPRARQVPLLISDYKSSIWDTLLLPSTLVLFYFRETCVFRRTETHTGNVFMGHMTQFCWFNKTCSSRRTSKWPGAGGGRSNKCRISRLSWTFRRLKIMENHFHGFSGYLSPPCRETKVVKRSHTICSLVASVKSYRWLRRATGPEPSSKNVCSVLLHFRGSGWRKIAVWGMRQGAPRHAAGSWTKRSSWGICNFLPVSLLLHLNTEPRGFLHPGCFSMAPSTRSWGYSWDGLSQKCHQLIVLQGDPTHSPPWEKGNLEKISTFFFDCVLDFRKSFDGNWHSLVWWSWRILG